MASPPIQEEQVKTLAHSPRMVRAGEWSPRIGASKPGPREGRYQNHAEESNFRG